MEKKEAAEAEEVETRIYVGGLGEKVTNDDLLKIFSSFGKVKALEIVRTKGRSFGYVDLLPSDKSLSKLFSTYNGCVWKGGRLRLEKAKEHYLSRLKREWAEDAEVLSDPVSDFVEADKDVAHLEKPKKVLEAEKKINIFFPRLRKVKLLPFSGTGKHKYSFQRVEAPPLPKHFCDCQEHSAPCVAAERKQIHHHTAGEEEIHDLESQGGGINEEELNLMNSVMRKLFDRENVSNGGHGPANNEHNSEKLIEDLQIGENEVDSVTDEDSLVINAVSRGNDRLALLRCQEKTTILPKNKKLTLSETRTSKDRLAPSVPKELETNKLPPNKKRKSLHNDETVVAANPVDDVNVQTNRNKLRRSLGTEHVEIESGVRQSTSSHLWSQKMSWKELVGDKDSRVFSVSNILPADASTEKAYNAMNSFEELEFVENESDEDNLIINVVSKRNNKMALSRSKEQEKISTMNQKLISNENKAYTDRSIEQKKSIPPPKKKRRSVINEESEGNKSVHTVPESAGSVQTHTNEMEMPVQAQPIEPERGVKPSITDHSENKSVHAIAESAGNVQTHTIEMEMPVQAQSNEPERGVKQSITHHSESKKPSSIGDLGNDKSSVSNLFSNNFAKEEKPISDIPDVPPGSTDSEKQKSARYENLKGKSAETESVEVFVGAQPTESNAAPNKSGNVSSWFQKSPWTQLVNDDNSSFSITQISPGITFKKQELSKSNMGKEIASPNDEKISKPVCQATSEPITHGSTAPGDGKEGDVVSQSIPPGKNQQTVSGNSEASASVVANRYESTPRQTIIGDFTIGETCPFMRSAASLKEWSIAKSALGGSQSHKRKSREK